MTAGVGAILQLAAPVLQHGMVCQYVPIMDGEPVQPFALRKGVDFIREQKAAGRVVLVACIAGISRSVSFATAALHEEEQIPLLEAYRSIRQLHSQALPHSRIWDSLCEYYQVDASYRDVMKIAFPSADTSPPEVL